jgi:hypothetical protein
MKGRGTNSFLSGYIGREEWVAMVKKAAVRTGKKKTTDTIKAVDERIGSTKNRPI